MQVFGAVDTMDMGLGDENDRIVPEQPQTFQKSNQQLHLLLHQFFLIVKDQFGPVGTIQMVNCDWETQETERKQKRFKDFLQSSVLKWCFEVDCGALHGGASI